MAALAYRQQQLKCKVMLTYDLNNNMSVQENRKTHSIFLWGFWILLWLNRQAAKIHNYAVSLSRYVQACLRQQNIRCSNRSFHLQPVWAVYTNCTFSRWHDNMFGWEKRI